MKYYRLLKIITLSLIFSCVALVSNAWATSLTEVFTAALQNDAQWQADQASAASEIAQSQVARAGLLPDVSAQASWKRFEQGSDVSPENTKYTGDSQSLQLRQPLFRLDKWNEYQASQEDKKSTQQTLLVNKAEFIERATTTYFDTLKAKLQDNVASLAQKEASLQYEAERLKAELSMVTAADVNRARANEFQAQSNAVLAKNNVLLQLDYLTQLTDLPFIILRPLSHVDIGVFSLDSLEQLKTRMYQKNAQLQSFRHVMESARYNTKKLRSLFAPQVDLVAQYGTSDSLQFTPTGQNVIEGDQTSFGVEMNWPIFQGGAKFSQLKAADLRNEALDAQYAKLAHDVERQLSNLWYQFKQSETLLQSKIYAQRSAQMFLERMELALELGEVSALEVASARVALQVEQQQLLIAKLDTISQWLSIKLLLAEVTPETITFIEQHLIFVGQEES